MNIFGSGGPQDRPNPFLQGMDSLGLGHLLAGAFPGQGQGLEHNPFLMAQMFKQMEPQGQLQGQPQGQPQGQLPMYNRPDPQPQPPMYNQPPPQQLQPQAQPQTPWPPLPHGATNEQINERLNGQLRWLDSLGARMQPYRR